MKTIFTYGFALLTTMILLSCNNSSKDASHDSTKSINVPADSVVYESPRLVVRKMSPHIYRHISYLQTNDFGKVECNGMVAVNGGKAVIFDTPANDSASLELINFVNKDLHSIITAIIPTHFHDDCVGGLKTFGEHHIPAYAFDKTIDILKKEGNKNVSLLKGFADSLTLDIGDQKVYAVFLGEGHAKDNIVGYFPGDSVLFGGCLIKEMGGSEGFLGDANVKAWPATVLKVKQKYPSARMVIPGHGKPGGTELLDYTISLFSKK
jgi:metallo-beta-lactamase class B